MEKKRFYITVLCKKIYDGTEEVIRYLYDGYTFEDIVECSQGLIKVLKRSNMLMDFSVIGINEVEQ